MNKWQYQLSSGNCITLTHPSFKPTWTADPILLTRQPPTYNIYMDSDNYICNSIRTPKMAIINHLCAWLCPKANKHIKIALITPLENNIGRYRDGVKVQWVVPTLFGCFLRVLSLHVLNVNVYYWGFFQCSPCWRAPMYWWSQSLKRGTCIV